MLKKAHTSGLTSNLHSKSVTNYLRVHDSGDYYSKKYLNKWIDIALLFPEVKFYSYTNMVEMMLYTSLPSNFDIIFSDSGKQKHMIDKIQHRHTKIFSSQEDLLSEGYTDASSIDLMATKWFNKTNKVGLIFH